MLAKRWIDDNIYTVNVRILMVKLAIGKGVMVVVSVLCSPVWVKW